MFIKPQNSRKKSKFTSHFLYFVVASYRQNQNCMKFFYPKHLTVLLLIGLLPGLCVAQAPSSLSSAEILLGLKKLNTLGSVLYVAAHPDDENTRLLTYMAKERLYRTGYLSVTRGDGGQNLIGDEQGTELGLIRTQELLAARRIDGGEQFFYACI